MELLDNFTAKGGKIHLNAYEIIVRYYKNSEKETYTDKTYYADEEQANELETDIVPKHQLMEIVSKTKLDNERFAYMEGIALKTQDFNKEIAEIASYGSLEAYEASLPESQDAFNMDIDYRISKIELGI
ncbi:MAG: hypothetical protein HFE49_00155 [Clostridia bacterium]|jgi:hypothetical protein|nr:hypothetical protein [Clostridia bacterium]